MAKTKHSFIDDNPYLVGTNAANTNVYADKPDVSIDAVFGDVISVYLVGAVPEIGNEFEAIGGINAIIMGGKPIMMLDAEGAYPGIATGATGAIYLLNDMSADDFAAYLVHADDDSEYTAVDEIDIGLEIIELFSSPLLAFKAPAIDADSNDFVVITYIGE